MQNNQFKSKENQILILIFAIVQIVFIIMLIISFRSISQDSKINDRSELPEVTIENLSSEVPSLSENYIKDIQASLTETIKLNQPELNITNSETIVRSESITIREFEEYEFYALSFIVDIPSLEQSYQIYYKYPTVAISEDEDSFSENPRAVLCLSEKSQIIYPNFKCHDNSIPETRRRIAKDYLSLMNFEDDNFAILFQDDNYPTTLDIITYDESLTKVSKESYISKVKSALDSIGVSTNLFNYQVRTMSSTYDSPKD